MCAQRPRSKRSARRRRACTGHWRWVVRPPDSRRCRGAVGLRMWREHLVPPLVGRPVRPQWARRSSAGHAPLKATFRSAFASAPGWAVCGVLGIARAGAGLSWALVQSAARLVFRGPCALAARRAQREKCGRRPDEARASAVLSRTQEALESKRPKNAKSFTDAKKGTAAEKSREDGRHKRSVERPPQVLGLGISSEAARLPEDRRMRTGLHGGQGA